MKRKISLLLGLLVMVLSFIGCAKTEEPIEYDEAAVGQMIDFLIQYSESVDEASQIGRASCRERVSHQV